jgi:hypothetical protein
MRRLFAIIWFRQLVAILLAFVVLVAVGAGLTGGLIHKPALWILGICVDAFVLLVLVPMMVVLGLRHMRNVDRMRSELTWAHWQYTEAEWKAYNELDADLSRRALVGPFLAVVALVVVVLFGLADRNAVLIGVGLFFAAFALSALLALALLSGPAAARRSPRGEVYVTQDGIHRVPGGYQPLAIGGYQALRLVELSTDSPAVLRFDCDVVRNTGQGSRVIVRKRTAEILVPAGRETEARELAVRFQKRIEQIGSRTTDRQSRIVRP